MTRSQLFGVFLGGVVAGALLTGWVVRPKPVTVADASVSEGSTHARKKRPKSKKKERNRKTGKPVRAAKAKRGGTSSGGSESSAPVLIGPPGPAVEAPNVVLVVVCTLRRDQLSFYGGHPDVSPFLERVVSRGTVFDHAWSAAPWTKAASTAIMTGHHPIQVGMVEPGSGSNRRRLSDSVDTLAEAFDGAGYWTIGLTANPNTNAVFGFDQGFDTYVEATGLWREGMVKVSGRRVAQMALDAMDERGDPAAPVYLRMMILDPHEPLKVSREDADEFADDDTPARVAKYRAMVARMDRAVSDLWSGLNARGFDGSNTILALVNDHGEGLSFPKHHGVGHGNLTFSSTVGMPWLMYGAGVAAGHRIGGVASQVDVMPTLLDLAGIAGYSGPGESHAPAVRGASATKRPAAYVDTWFQGASRAAVYTVQRSCHQDFRTPEQLGDKVRRLPPQVCYDQAADPYQRTPLASLDTRLIEQLDAWRADRMVEYERFDDTVDALMSRAMKEQLEALGYVDADNEDAPATSTTERLDVEMADTDVALDD